MAARRAILAADMRRFPRQCGHDGADAHKGERHSPGGAVHRGRSRGAGGRAHQSEGDSEEGEVDGRRPEFEPVEAARGTPGACGNGHGDVSSPGASMKINSRLPRQRPFYRVPSWVVHHAGGAWITGG